MFREKLLPVVPGLVRQKPDVTWHNSAVSSEELTELGITSISSLDEKERG